MQTAPNCAAAPLNTGVGVLCKGGLLYAGCAILVVFIHDPGLSYIPLHRQAWPRGARFGYL